MNKQQNRRNTSSRRSIKRVNNATNKQNIITVPMRSPTMLYPGRDASAPATARVRAIVVLSVGQQNLALSYLGFGNWFPYARSILAPYRYFRIRDLCVQVLPSGGAASVTSTAFNAVNDVYSDTTAITILNDDYCALSNAITRPILHPPGRYWSMGSRVWYTAIDPIEGLPSLEERTNGVVNLDTQSGSLAAGSPVGFITVEASIEFHTLV